MIIARLAALFKKNMNGGYSVKNQEVESGVLGMGDVGVMICMIDRSFVGRPMEPEHLERALYILEAVFEQRYTELKAAYFGGDGHA